MGMHNHNSLAGAIRSMITRLCLLAATVVSVSSVANGQAPDVAVDPAKRAAIRRILEISKAADQVIRTMEAAMPAQRATNPLIPDAFWDRFLKRARERRGEFIDALVPIYDRHFSLSELNEIIRFYETPIGKRLLVATPLIINESMQEGQRWGFRLGQEIGEELAREGVAPKG